MAHLLVRQVEHEIRLDEMYPTAPRRLVCLDVLGHAPICKRVHTGIADTRTRA